MVYVLVMTAVGEGKVCHICHISIPPYHGGHTAASSPSLGGVNIVGSSSSRNVVFRWSSNARGRELATNIFGQGRGRAAGVLIQCSTIGRMAGTHTREEWVDVWR